MVGDGNSQMGFQHSSELFDSSNGGGKDCCYGSGWDPIAPLSQDGNLGANLMVSQANLGLSGGASQFMHYLSDTSAVQMLPKFPGFGGGGGFPQYVNPYCISRYAEKGENATMGSVQSQEEPQISEERSRVASPNGKRKRNVGRNMQRDSSGEISDIKDSDEKKQKIEESGSSDQSNKQTGRQTKGNCSGEEDSKGYIHMRARRGQATNSHSLAERVRREKINERMKLLQELVPGCSKITGKALMLDEIINYVQSLQQQVEFLSMKLANVNPEINFDVDQILSKDILHSRGIPGFNPGSSSSHLGTPSIHHGALSGITPYQTIPQGMWEGELQSLHHIGMGFDLNPTLGNLGSNAQ